jgi:hypothetical protein
MHLALRQCVEKTSQLPSIRVMMLSNSIHFGRLSGPQVPKSAMTINHPSLPLFAVARQQLALRRESHSCVAENARNRTDFRSFHILEVQKIPRQAG